MGDRRGPPNIDGLITIKVDNISYGSTADDVRHIFEKFGDVGDVYIPRDHRSNESRGFAFVRYYREKDAEYAMEEMDGREFRGRTLRIEYAKRRRPEDPREFYSSRDRDRDYDRGRGRDDRYDRRDRRSRSRERRRSPSPRRRSRSGDRRKDRRDSRSRSPRDRGTSRRSRSPEERREVDRDVDKENDRDKNAEEGGAEDAMVDDKEPAKDGDDEGRYDD